MYNRSVYIGILVTVVLTKLNHAKTTKNNINFLTQKLANSKLSHSRKAKDNSGLFEEVGADSIERECYEERCSKEELYEVYNHKNQKKADKKYEEWTNICRQRYCSSQGTDTCVQKWQQVECICKEGWQHDSRAIDWREKTCSQDVDECRQSEAYSDEKVCKGRNEYCVNTEGSYRVVLQNVTKIAENG